MIIHGNEGRIDDEEVVYGSEGVVLNGGDLVGDTSKLN